MKDLKTISQRVNQLSNQQRKLLVELLSKVDNDEPVKCTNQLVAFITTDQKTDPVEIKDHLKRRLPEFMVPANIIQLDYFPKLPNGKIDKQALSSYYQRNRSSSKEGAQELTALEEQLIKIWEEVLDFSPINVNDNFFEIGGDSILSIQIVAKARKAGIALTPTLLFEHQSIVELAKEVKLVTDEAKAPSEFSGPVVLTPIQQWFFEQHQAAPHYWNQALRIDLNPDVTPENIRNAAKQLLENHDALRLSFNQREGNWYPELKNSPDIEFFVLHDISQLPVSEQDSQIAGKLHEIQQNTSLEKGGLFKHVYFQCNPQQPDRLILLAHHLVIDAVSWNIVLDDLNEFVRNPQQLQGATAESPTSFATLGNYLQQLASSEEVLKDLSFWESQRASKQEFPLDFQVDLPVSEQTMDRLTNTDPVLTPEILKDSKGIERLNLEELLITALTLSITKWCNNPELLLGIERHGRNLSGAPFDLSRSVGWFTAYYPVLLNIEQPDNPETALKAVKNQLQKIHKSGLSYGLLRYTEGKTSLDQRPPVVFNFLGKRGVTNKAALGSVQVVEQDTRHPNSERNYYLEVNAMLVDNEIVTTWHYSRKQFRQQTIEGIAQSFSSNLNILLKYATRESGAYSATDFPEADISQKDLNNLLDQL